MTDSFKNLLQVFGTPNRVFKALVAVDTDDKTLREFFGTLSKEQQAVTLPLRLMRAGKLNEARAAAEDAMAVRLSRRCNRRVRDAERAEQNGFTMAETLFAEHGDMEQATMKLLRGCMPHELTEEEAHALMKLAEKMPQAAFLDELDGHTRWIETISTLAKHRDPDKEFRNWRFICDDEPITGSVLRRLLLDGLFGSADQIGVGHPSFIARQLYVDHNGDRKAAIEAFIARQPDGIARERWMVTQEVKLLQRGMPAEQAAA